MVINYIIVFLGTMVIAFGRAYPYENSIKWVEAPNSQILLLNLVPAGRENNIILYLCRIHYQKNTVTGKLYIENGNIRCIVPYRKKQYLSPKFEVLVTFPEVLSWKPFKGHIKDNTLFSGIIDGVWSYVCRAKVNNYDLIPGRLGGRDKFCYVAKDGYELTIKENFEFLGKNYLGISMNTPFPRKVENYKDADESLNLGCPANNKM